MNRTFPFILFIFLCTGIFNVCAQENFKILFQEKYPIPANFENKIGFVPTDFTFISDSSFLIHTYYSGIYKMKIRNNGIICTDSFNLSQDNLLVFENILRQRYRENSMVYSLHLPKSNDLLPFKYGASTSNLTTYPFLSAIFDLYFFEKIESDSIEKSTLIPDSLRGRVRTMTIYRIKPFLLLFNNDLTVKKVIYEDSDYLYPTKLPWVASYALIHYQWIDSTDIRSTLTVYPDQMDQQSSLLANWSLKGSYLEFDGIDTNVTLSESQIKMIQSKVKGALNMQVSSARIGNTHYFSFLNSIFMVEHGGKSEMIIKAEESFTREPLLHLEPYGKYLILFYYQREEGAYKLKALNSENMKEIELNSQLIKGSFFSIIKNTLYVLAKEEEGSYILRKYTFE